MIFLKYFCIFLLIVSLTTWGRPRTTVTFNINPAGYTQVKIKNETLESLACFVAIDGFKKKFQIRARSSSQWITAADIHFNYRHFSTWCDYLDVHPEYKAYTAF